MGSSSIDFRPAVRPPGQHMRKVFLSLAALCCLLLWSASVTAQSSTPVQTISVDQIHTGMRGVAYTVFQGVKPESMDVEVLGIMHNVNGPKGDVILVRLWERSPSTPVSLLA